MISLLLAAVAFVEAEGFADFGGWTLDPSSTSEMARPT